MTSSLPFFTSRCPTLPHRPTFPAIQTPKWRAWTHSTRFRLAYAGPVLAPMVDEAARPGEIGRFFNIGTGTTIWAYEAAMALQEASIQDAVKEEEEEDVRSLGWVASDVVLTAQPGLWNDMRPHRL